MLEPLGRRAFFQRARRARVGADGGRVNNQVFKVGVIGTMLMQLLEDALLAPAREALIDAVPVAILCR